MKINHAEYTIAEMVEQYSRKVLVINRKYQRGGGLWPVSAQTYFLDTILQSYPFPKLYFYQIYDRTRKIPTMEVVDGQQRLLTIMDFLGDKIRLTKASGGYSGKFFSDLEEAEQEAFLMYRVPVDVIFSAQRPELLEMFRRMNAYTAPLNAAEKRHSKYQGCFKWFAVEISDRLSPLFEGFEILTTKQIVRMSDAVLIAELVLILEEGLTNRSETQISKLYERYEEFFGLEQEYFGFIVGFFEMLTEDFSALAGTHLMKPYAIYSIFAAYAHIKKGIPNGEEVFGFPSRAKEIRKGEAILAELLVIADAHETKDVEGKYGDYVAAAISTTTKAAQRKVRSRVIAGVIDPG
ncbi:MAG: DUF262 domain-containing protein [Gammaproteobacteria bacterium]|nr:DUF262 domain-containing protein [Gammaproteobacteria bacterium]